MKLSIPIKLIAILAGMLLFMFVLPAVVQAQALLLNPDAGSLSIGVDHAIEVRASNPPPGVNTAIITLVGPGSLIQFKGIQVPGGVLKFDCNGYPGGFDSDEICVILAKPGAGNFYTDGELILTIGITAVADGQAALDFVNIGSETAGYTDGVTSFNFTDRGGVYVTGAGGGSVLAGAAGTLPDTGIIDEPRDFMMFMGFVIIMAILVNRIGYVFKFAGLPVKPNDWLLNIFRAVKDNDSSQVLDIEQIEKRERQQLTKANEKYQTQILDSLDS